MSNNNSTHASSTSANIAEVVAALGQPRLAPYRSFFGCQSDEQLLGAYFWGQAIGGAFQPTLGMYEIVLRNAVHLAASKFSSKGTSNSHPWYDASRADALPIRGKTLEKVREVLYSGEPPLRRAPQPTPDAVVASLSFGFWPSFLDGLTKREQPRILTDAFAAHPNATPRHWGFSVNVQDLIQTLKRIQELRNAVAHHEPIWKPHRLKGNEANWTHSVRSLREKHADMLKVMAWCCPATATAVEHSYATRIFKSICSTDAVRAFMSDPLGAGAMQAFSTSPPLIAVQGSAALSNGA